MLRHMTEFDSAIVEQAKGALMLRYGIGSRESLAVLDRWACEAQVPLRDVADALVTGICLGRVTPDTEGMVRWLEQRLRGEVRDVRDERGADVDGAQGDAAEPRSRRSATALVTAHVPPEAASGSAGARQWRYSSAVHAARVMRSR